MKTIGTMLLLLITMAVFSQETVTIGSQTWMAKNLNVGTMLTRPAQPTNNGIAEKWCYGDQEAMCDKFGGYYQLDELMAYQTQPGVQGLCPTGFHIPTYAEWMVLIEYCGGIANAGTQLNENSKDYWVQYGNWTPTNSTGMGLRGGGWVVTTRQADYKYYGNYWTSSTAHYAEVPGYEQYAALTDINPVVISSYYGMPSVSPVLRYANAAYNVRCIQDVAPDPTPLPTGSTVKAIQCIGKTLKGVQCRNITKNANGYCFQHQSQVK
jgi:uncharacterized protein (TIGR02145 family)